MCNGEVKTMAEEAKKMKFDVKKLVALVKENPIPFAVLAVSVVYLIVAMVVSSLKLEIPWVTAGAFVVLEGVLAALLNKIPVWVHGLFFIGMIVAGIAFHEVVFMVLMAFVYVACVALLYAWTRDYK
jgi:predicted ABC-type sugar transport system permease subunit